MEQKHLAQRQTSQSMLIFGVIIWLVLFAFGLHGLYDRLAFDSLQTDMGSYIPWGLWVSSYIWFIGLSAGSFLLSTLVYVFKLKQLEKVAPLALVVALITLIMALLSIWFDLGHMGRFYGVYLHPNFHSAMAWMVWLYTAYFVLLIFETYFALRGSLVRSSFLPGIPGIFSRILTGGRQEALSEEEVRRDRRKVTTLATLGIPLAIAFHGGVGALFATVVARDVWHTSLYPILFLVGAFLSGGALFTGLIAFFWPKRDDYWQATVHLLGRVTLGLLLLEAVLTWAELSVPMWYGVGPEYEELRYMLFGPYGWVFWVVQVGLCTVLPLILLVAGSKSPRMTGWAGILVAVTFLSTRLNLVLPGLVAPELAGLPYSYHDGRLTYQYLPSGSEWQLLAFIISVGIALYFLAVKVMPTLTGRDVA